MRLRMLISRAPAFKDVFRLCNFLRKLSDKVPGTLFRCAPRPSASLPWRREQALEVNATSSQRLAVVGDSPTLTWETAGEPFAFSPGPGAIRPQRSTVCSEWSAVPLRR